MNQLQQTGPEILYPAILRPGRLEQQVLVDRPDINGRKDRQDPDRLKRPAIEMAITKRNIEWFSKEQEGFIIKEK